MRRSSRSRCILKAKDVELVLDRFEEEYADSLIYHRFALDTSKSSATETFQEFLRQMKPHLTDVDRARISAHRALIGAPSR